MEYYVIQVKTNDEDEFLRRASVSPAARHGRLFVPKRSLNIRRLGKTQRRDLPVFPGYIFLEIEDFDDEARWDYRHVPGFCRILTDGEKPKPLGEKDRALLQHFISFGKRADISKVTFDEKDRIVVIEGAMKGLEGRIEKVDRRKGRARIRLDLYEDSFAIDFGFEEVRKVGQGGCASHDEP
ncbi:MAG: antiterminator LoaP [Spirochaetaceae bacterium]|nr:antiterminator LoaP [Spirochaetaceae bacterium]